MKRLAIITNKPFNQCETFIKAQIELLGLDIRHFYFHHSGLVEGNKDTESRQFRIKEKFYRNFERVIGSRLYYKIRSYKNAKILSYSRIDKVLAQYGHMGAEILPSVQLLKVPLIVHFHGHEATRDRIIKKYGETYKQMFRYKDTRIISVSRFMSEELIKLGCPEEKITLIQYGPNDKFFDLNPSYSSLQFSFVGRFVPKKSPITTIKAFKQVYEINPEVTLVMAGDGLLKKECELLVNELGLQKNVFFPGRLNPKGVRELFENSFCYVQHSVVAEDGDIEGTPVSILEASASGLPVVSTLHSGIPDVIDDGISGYLVNEHDEDGMADRMTKFALDQKKAKELGQHGRSNIRNNFTMDHYMGKLRKLIASA